MSKQTLVPGPTSKCPSSQLYCTLAPTLKLGAIIVELGGCSGRPQAFGSAEGTRKVNGLVEITVTVNV